MTFRGESVPVVQEDVLTYLFGSCQEDDDKKGCDTEPEFFCPDLPILTSLSEDSNGAMQKQSLTYSACRKMIRQVAGGFTERGITQGTRIVIMSRNRLNYWPLLLGCIGARAAFIGVHPEHTRDDLAFYLLKSQANLLVIGKELQDIAAYAIEEAGLENCPVLVLDDEVEQISDDYLYEHWSNLLHKTKSEVPFRWVSLSPEEQRNEETALVFTSGSTGRRKGAEFTHTSWVGALSAPISLERSAGAFQRRSLCTFPVGHYAVVNDTFRAIKARDETFIISDYSANFVTRIIEEYRVNLIMCSAILTQTLARDGTSRDLSSIESIQSGGTSIFKSTMNAFRLMCAENCVFNYCYGATETGNITHILRVTDGIDTGHCIGQMGPNVEVRIVDSETGKSLGRNEIGEFWIRNPSSIKGYWNDETNTKNAITEDGFVNVGDLGYVDDNDTWWFCSRMKEVLKVRGRQVLPADIVYWVKRDAPDVSEMVVLGLPAPDGGDIPKAYLTLKPNSSVTANDIHEIIKARLNPINELTGGVEIVDVMPKLTTGKIDMLRLKRMATETPVVSIATNDALDEVEAMFNKSLATTTVDEVDEEIE